MIATGIPELGLDWPSVITVWRLLVVSGAAFSVGMSVVIATKVFRNSTWHGVSMAFAILMSMAAVETVTRIDMDTFTWRLPFFTIAVAAALTAQRVIIQTKVNPYDTRRG